MTVSCACPWCGRQFTPRLTGGKDQRFCRSSCRRALHAAARAWALAEIAADRLDLDAIRNGLPAPRALTGMSGGPSPAPDDTADEPDALLAELLAVLPDDALLSLPDGVLDRISAFLDYPG